MNYLNSYNSTKYLSYRLSVLQLNLMFLVLKYVQLFMKTYKTLASECTNAHMRLLHTSTFPPTRKKSFMKPWRGWGHETKGAMRLRGP